MKRTNPPKIYHNSRVQFLITIILLLFGVAFCVYMAISVGSPSPSHPLITKTSEPLITYTATHSTLSPTTQEDFFNKIWTIVNDNYLYTNFNGLDWSAIRSEYIQKIGSGLSEDNFYQEMEILINKLGNRHTQFLPPSKNKINDAGIGAGLIIIPGENRVDVTVVFPNSSAAHEGILPHDRILSVDGGVVPTDMLELLSVLNGDPGTKVSLLVQTPEQKPRQVILTRGYIQEPIPVPYKKYTSSTGKKIGYLVLVSFNYGSLKDQITEAINAMSSVKPLDGLIVDVRANPGGQQSVALETLSFFAHGTIGYYITRNGKDLIDVPDRDINGSSYIPLVVLISSITTSGGAIFAGILQDMDRAFLIGENTGKALDSAKLFPFSDGSELEVAIAAIHPINHPDVIWTDTGIVPDMNVKTDWDEFMTDSDPVIQAALDYFDR